MILQPELIEVKGESTAIILQKKSRCKTKDELLLPKEWQIITKSHNKKSLRNIVLKDFRFYFYIKFFNFALKEHPL